MFNTLLKKQLAECQQDYQDSQAKLSALDRSMAVIEFDTSGNVLTANANFLRLLGYELNEVIGKHHRLFLFEADSQSAAYQEFWQQLNAGKYVSNRFKRKSKSGEIIWIEANYNPVLNKLGQVTKIVKFATDITARAKAESDAKGQLAAIYRSMAVIEFSLDGKILNANDNFLSVIGYTLAEIQGKHHQIFVKPDYAKQSEYQQFWNRLATENTFRTPSNVLRKTATVFGLKPAITPFSIKMASPIKWLSMPPM
jgi:methyl-accepting chemotaxis protein